MTGKKAMTPNGGGAVMGDAAARRRPSFAKKNKAFQMLQRDMEQVTCGQKYLQNPYLSSLFLFGNKMRFRFVSLKQKGFVNPVTDF